MKLSRGNASSEKLPVESTKNAGAGKADNGTVKYEGGR